LAKELSMKRLLMIVAVVGVLAVGGASRSGAQVKPGVLAKPGDGDQVCTGDFGTNVKFVKTPSDAGKQALKEEKLVLVLHVSGDFEDPDFT
jgi:hypothetical protein